MKIGVLIDALHSGGVEKIAIRQVQALNKSGQDACLLVLKKTDTTHYPFLEYLQAVPVVYLDDRLPKWLKMDFKIPFFSFFSLYHLTSALFIPWVFSKKEADFIISHGTYTSLSAISLKLFRKISFMAVIWDPIVYIIKKSYPTGTIYYLRFIILPLAHLVDKLISIKANALIVGGHPHITYLKSLGAKRIYILYPGADPVKKIAVKRPDLILMVTSWNSGKKPDYNLEIVKQIPNAKMIIAGSWHPKNLKAQFKKMIEDSGLGGRVEVTGPISEVKLNQLYDQAAVFLQTSDDRGFGMPALEAASRGCALVIPRGQGVGELFIDGEDGYYTNIRDTKDITSKLNTILNNEKKACQMGESGWKKVVAKYSWEQHAGRLLKYIDEVIL